MKMIKTVSVILAAIFALSAQSKDITAKEFEQLSPQEAMSLAHDWHGKGKNQVAVTAQAIEAVLSNGEKAKIPLGDQFFVSVAPYIKQTHECSFHVPTGCTGEMKSKKMILTITDKDSGEIIRNEEIKVQKDGFVDLWLPRNKAFVVTFDYKGKKASQVLTTNADSLTCITTMRLI